MLKGFQEGFLNYVLGVLEIVGEVLSNSKKFTVVSLYKFLKGGKIAILAGMD